VSINALRFRVGVSGVLGLIWTSAAPGQGPLFGPAVHYAAGDEPLSVAIGDLNGDQAPDLAVANYNSNNVSVLLNESPWPCYADCDQSTGVGVLDLFDFLCFQNSFVNSEPYACDCDTSTGNGVCDIFDFLCIQNAFVSGCP